MAGMTDIQNPVNSDLFIVLSYQAAHVQYTNLKSNEIFITKSVLQTGVKDHTAHFWKHPLSTA